MGRLFLLSIVLVSTLSACTFHKKEENISGPVRVQLPFAVEGKYSLQVVELITLENLIALKGLAARFLIDPDTVSGKLQGRDPEIRYIRDSDDIVIAKDILSLQLLTVYAHFEKMRALDQQLGVTEKVIWPAKIAVNAKYKTEDGRLENNALYSGQHDALLMVPYTRSDLPIMVNAGVLAHEHFHNIFQKMVIDPLGKKYPSSGQATGHDEKKMLQIFGASEGDIEQTDSGDEEKDIRATYHETIMRALNEGFADVWGWVYSGDDDFVGKSLPSEKLRRRLDVQLAGGLESMISIKNHIFQGMSSQSLLGYSYTLGTQYARMLRTYATKTSESKNISLQQARLEVGTYLLKVLPELAKKYDSLNEQEYLRPTDVIDIFISQAKDRNPEDCLFFAKFIPSSEISSSSESKCKSLEESVP